MIKDEEEQHYDLSLITIILLLTFLQESWGADLSSKPGNLQQQACLEQNKQKKEIKKNNKNSFQLCT